MKTRYTLTWALLDAFNIDDEAGYWRRSALVIDHVERVVALLAVGTEAATRSACHHAFATGLDPFYYQRKESR